MVMGKRRSRRPNGEGHYRRRKDGRYERQIVINVQGKYKRSSVYGRDLRELNRNTEELRRRIGAGWLPGRGDMRVKELAERWLAAVLAEVRQGRKSFRTYGHYEEKIRNHIVPEIGDLSIDRVSDHRLNEVMDRAATAGRSEQTVTHIDTVMRRMFKFGMEQGWLAQHPMRQMEKRKARPYKPYVLNQQEADRYLAAAEKQSNLGAALIVLSVLANREGETLALRQSAINNHGRIEIFAHLDRLPRSLRPSEDDDGYVIVKGTKWGSDREPVLPPIVKEALHRQGVRQAERRLAAGTKWHDTIRVMRQGRLGDYVCEKNDLLFTTDDGRPLDPHVLRDAHIKVCGEAGIPWSAKGAHGLRIHDLRHSSLSLLIAAGLSAQEAMAVAGHKSPQMLRHYTHIEEQAHAKAAVLMQKVFGRRPVTLRGH